MDLRHLRYIVASARNGSFSAAAHEFNVRQPIISKRIKEVEDELADLFLELAVHEDQLHYPVYYAVGRAGKAWAEVPADPEADGAQRAVVRRGLPISP